MGQDHLPNGYSLIVFLLLLRSYVARGGALLASPSHTGSYYLPLVTGVPCRLKQSLQ